MVGHKRITDTSRLGCERERNLPLDVHGGGPKREKPESVLTVGGGKGVQCSTHTVGDTRQDVCFPGETRHGWSQTCYVPVPWQLEEGVWILFENDVLGSLGMLIQRGCLQYYYYCSVVSYMILS